MRIVFVSVLENASLCQTLKLVKDYKRCQTFGGIAERKLKLVLFVFIRKKSWENCAGTKSSRTR